MSIPTSLVIVLLVVAWLAVLVPMVARRREAVLRTDRDGGRVLRRAAGRVRRRPHLGRRVVDQDAEDLGDDGLRVDTVEREDEGRYGFDQDSDRQDRDGQGRDEDGMDLDGVDDRDLADEDEAVDGGRGRRRLLAGRFHRTGRPTHGSHPVRVRGAQATLDDRYEDGVDELDADLDAGRDLADEGALDDELMDNRYDVENLDESEDDAEDVGDRALQARDGRSHGAHPVAPSRASRYAAVDEYDDFDQGAAGPAWSEHAAAPADDVEDDERYRPVPRRHGRGGYDPEAAEATRAYKYSRRRRVALFLLLLTVAFGVGAAAFARPALWAGTAVAGLLLVGYLAYLRRQVRIEADIRQRRLAKLRRARQIRPEYHQRGYADGAAVQHPYGPPMVGEPEPVAPAVPAAPVAPAAVSHGRRMVVDVEDDDPGFEDLEYYHPVTYRRAAGQ
ncbi:divisome protein SepX/GlpR [Nakamurella endophytica]|uniref:Transmembrane protein n=1 Tax=Nakamurella endophytica TaxID=1748367 RepID=A0A917WAR3_9ACTN|nr:gephyrin-like molybdotransferase receptor GlpR [Nakamurella endophytica]GGL88167.1 hypothetical protein GCM10011594_04720 [Nakamurella endophytica]